MTWIRLDDGYLDHPKFRRLLRLGGANALYLWHGALAWCAQHLTDGVIPADMLDEPRGPTSPRARARAWDALVECGLCTRAAPDTRADGTPHGRVTHALHDYTDYQPSAERVRAARVDAAQRQQRSRIRRLRGESQRDSAGRDQPSHSPVTAPRARDPDPDLDPDPDPDLSSERSNARAREPRGGGVVRVYSVPSAEPPPEYLDEAVMRGVSREQAASTWSYYRDAGLPPQGVERLYGWLLRRASERAAQLAKHKPIGTPRKTKTLEDVLSEQHFGGLDL